MALGFQQSGFTFNDPVMGSMDIASIPDQFAGLSGSNRPAFDEFTSAFRAPLRGYASIGMNGNANAAANYADSVSALRDANRRYGEGRSTGANDMTATSSLRIAMDSGLKLKDKLLTAADPYVDRLNLYVNRQAVQRGLNPDKIMAEEEELDSRFRSSYRSYLDKWKSSTSREVSDYVDPINASPATEHFVSLRIREALSRYEGTHGLYSTLDRGETLDEAARLLARVNGNSRLNSRFGRDYDTIVGMAAKRVLQGDRSANLVDLVDGDMADLSGSFVTYSGTDAGDKAKGFLVYDRDGRSVETGLAPLVRGVLADQAIEDRMAGRDRFSNLDSLRAKMYDRLSRRYASAGMSFDDATRQRVFGAAADSLAKQAVSGSVNLSKLGELFLRNPILTSTDVPVKIPAFDWNKVGDFGDQMVAKYIGGRPNFYMEDTGSFLRGIEVGADYLYGKAKSFLFGGNPPKTFKERVEDDRRFTDPETIRKNVQNDFVKFLRESGIGRDVISSKSDALDSYANQVADAIYYANRPGGGDPSVAGPGDQKGYANGIRNILASIAISQNLRDIGFDVPDIAFGDSFGYENALFSDRGHRYRDPKISFQNAFGGLKEFLDGYVKGVDPDKLDDPMSFVRYNAALSYRNGLDSLRKAGDGSAVGKKEIAAMTADAVKSLGIKVGFADTPTGNVSVTDLPQVRDSWATRSVLETAKLNGPENVKDLPARMMLDRLLQAGFSDRTNPVRDKRIKEAAVSLMNEFGNGFEKGENYDSWLNLVMSAVDQSDRDFGTLSTKTGEDGKAYVVFDPMSNLMDDTEFMEGVKRRNQPLLARMKRVSDKLVEDHQKMAGALQYTRSYQSKKAAEAAENGL